MTIEADQPDIFEYLDYRSYLRDWFEHRKSTHPEFSHEYFMRRAGLGSKATLHNVITGRRNPRGPTLDAFARGMELDEAESAYLEKLVELALCKTLDDRREVLRSMIENPLFHKDRRIQAEPSEAEARFMARWYCWAIWEFARAPGFRAEPVWLASMMIPPISEREASEALEILFGLGFLEKAADGTVKTRELRLSTNTVVTNQAIYQYYKANLQNAQLALDRVPPAERTYRGLTLLIPAGLLPELQAKIDQFAHELMRDSDEALRSDVRAYHLGMQLFPMTYPVGSVRPEEE